MSEAHQKFEDDLREMMLEALREDPQNVGREIWSALANVDWYHPDDHHYVAYSFRAAGGLIADMLATGDYMDWYCSGPYAEVSDRMARSMRKKGWIYTDTPEICDEPGCLRYVSSGWPSDEGYRRTCNDHYEGKMS